MAKYKIEFGEAFDKLLEKLAQETATTKADLLRRAMETYAYVEIEPATPSRSNVERADARPIAKAP